jgi:radical SAM superfamily enzyme YgiQ (UPF0313 family)
MSGNILIIDALSAGMGQRKSSRDSIGCGPRSVAGVFEKHDLGCRIYRVEDVLAKRSILKQYEHLAVSAMTMDTSAVLAVLKSWQNKTRPHGRSIIGGPITSDPTVLKTLSADVLVIGEGEETLSELILTGFLECSIDLASIKGVAYQKAGHVYVTPAREFIPAKKLSEEYIPSTTRIIDYRAYQASKVYVEVTRGCSNFRRTTLPLTDGRQCSDCGNCDSADPRVREECPEEIPPGCGFCSVPGIWGPPRSRSIDAIVKEVQELLELGVHRIVLESPGFLDYMRGSEPLTDPCHPPANLMAIQTLLTKINELPQVRDKTVHVTIENMKACLFTEAVAKMLVASTFSSSPNIGLETGSEKHLRSIGKCGTPTDVLSAVKTAVKYGLKPFVYFIYGLPGEDAESTQESIRMMHAISDVGAERIILYGFRPLPGSAFEGFPESSTRDPFGIQLRRAAEKINREKKKDYVGLVVSGIAAEPSLTHRGFTMVYPLDESPLIAVRGGFSSGTRLRIQIAKVLSSGLVEGKVVQDNNREP